MFGEPKPESVASAAPGCTKDSDCKGDRVCEKGTCSAPKVTTPEPEPEPTSTATAQRNLQSYPCNDIRCEKGQRCCPGAKTLCIPGDTTCGPGSMTTVGYTCDVSTHEPCPEPKKCKKHKLGANPMTTTTSCE
jgi:hypothetical protein